MRRISIDDLCDHEAPGVWRVSCHSDLTSEQCKSGDQRSVIVCADPECFTAAAHWVAQGGHAPVRIAVQWPRPRR